MAKKRIYLAQGFWLRSGRLVGGEPMPFHTEARAIAGATILLQGAAGVTVYSVEGHPDEDLWDEPQIIVQLGATPSIEEAA